MGAEKQKLLGDHLFWLGANGPGHLLKELKINNKKCQASSFAQKSQFFFQNSSSVFHKNHSSPFVQISAQF